MRILFCNYEYPPLGGGGGVVTASLAEELATRHDVTVLTSQAMGLPDTSEVRGVRVIRVPVFFRYAYAAANFPSMLAYLPMGMRRGSKLLAQEKFDVINTHFVLPTGPVGDSLAHTSGTPNVVSVHGGDLYDPSKFLSPHRHWFLRIWIRKLLNRADSVIGQSKNTLENMQTYYTPDVDGIRIPLGITRPDTPSARRADFGFADSDKLLITVSRLVSRKAVNQLIQVVHNLQDESVHLIIIGGGPDEEALRRQCVEAGLNDNVHFMGQVDDAKKYSLLKVADAFVSTSQHEGFGLVFLEAMAMATPVICYNNGGQTDFLVDGKTGGVIPLNDIDRFTESVRSIIEDSSWAERIGQSNLQQMEEYFIDTCALRYEQVFEDVIRTFREKTKSL